MFADWTRRCEPERRIWELVHAHRFQIVSYYQYALVCFGIFATCRWMAGNGMGGTRMVNESMLKRVIA